LLLTGGSSLAPNHILRFVVADALVTAEVLAGIGARFPRIRHFKALPA